jgi:hypothetical protein
MQSQLSDSSSKITNAVRPKMSKKKIDEDFTNEVKLLRHESLYSKMDSNKNSIKIIQLF